MARNLRRTQNIDYTLKFNGLESIYDENGALRTNLGDNIDWNGIINSATSQGYGSVNIGGQEYTLYKKNKDGNIIKPWELEGWNKENVDLNDASSVAIYNYYHPNNKQTFLGSSAVNPSNTLINPSDILIAKEELIDKEGMPDAPTPISFNGKYNLSEDLLGNILSMPDSGRKSNFRLTLGLYEDLDKYFSNPDVIRNMNRYYGEGNWNGRSYLLPSKGYRIDPRKSMRNTLDYIFSNANLTKDRMGKTQDYLAMESLRLDRSIGNYNGMTYRDLLDYFSDENNTEWKAGKYGNDYNKFMQELYELGASHNGMLNHEFKRLFGDSYGNVMTHILNLYLKDGGILEMLFI